MAKKKEVEEFDIDDSELELQLTETTQVIEDKPVKRNYKREPAHQEEGLVNCLRNERITVRHIPKARGMISNPRHILYGGMAENATRHFTVPKLSSGVYVNVLTNSEKEYLEEIMGLEYNALSVHKKVDNYWENRMVRLTKQDNILNLSDPEQYISYKILLSNSNFIASSLTQLQDTPKATYQFVIIEEGEETKADKDNMTSTMEAYREFGRIDTDADKLRLIVETIDGRPTSANVKIEFLQTKINKLIQSDSKMFLRVVQDKYLDTKVLIKKSIEAGLISKRGDFLYLTDNNEPLCEQGQNPTLNIAAKYLNNPKRQSVKLMLEAKTK